MKVKFKRLKNEISLYALFKYQTFMLAFAFAVFKQRAIYAGYFCVFKKDVGVYFKFLAVLVL